MEITDYAKGKVEGLKAAHGYVMEFRVNTEKAGRLLTPSMDACVPIACQIKVLVEVENDLYAMLVDAKAAEAEARKRNGEG